MMALKSLIRSRKKSYGCDLMGRAHRRYGLERRRTKADSLRAIREARTTREQEDALDARLGAARGASRERRQLLYKLAIKVNKKTETEARDFAMMGRRNKRR